MNRWLNVSVFVLIVVLACASPLWSQTSTTLETLLKEIQALKEGQAAIQKELEALKALMQKPPAPVPAPRVTVETVDQILNVAGAPTKGSAEAKVVLVEFTDYQCPFCQRHSIGTMPSIENDYVKSGKVRYVFRDFPIPSLHPQAAKAAEAAQCAGDQGKYWDMHKQLFANQRKLSAFDLVNYAQAVGVNRETFESCMERHKHAATVERGVNDGKKGGVTGTPTIFLGLADAKGGAVKVTKRIQGAQPYTVFRDAIEAMLKTVM